MISGANFVVLDDFLGQHELELLYKEFRLDAFTLVNVPNFSRVFRIYDGQPLRGTPNTQALTERNPGADCVIRKGSAVADLALKVAGVIAGRTFDLFQGRVLSKVSSATYVFPAGTALSWHDDGGACGAFIYYVHKMWRPEWGGELLVSSPHTDEPQGKWGLPEFEPMFEDRLLSQSIMRDGTGTYIIPKPNRLVFIRGGAAHTIKKVDAAAGNNTRCTVSGFLYSDL